MPFIEVTSVKLKIPTGTTINLFAYATIELGGSIVIRDAQIYRKPSGELSVAMPERTLSRKCPDCHCRISQLDAFCGRCGQPQDMVPREDVKYRDVVFPSNREQREEIESAVIGAYHAELRVIEIAHVEEGGDR